MCTCNFTTKMFIISGFLALIRYVASLFIFRKNKHLPIAEIGGRRFTLHCLLSEMLGKSLSDSIAVRLVFIVETEK